LKSLKAKGKAPLAVEDDQRQRRSPLLLRGDRVLLVEVVNSLSR
jgi:hypothetical protein